MYLYEFFWQEISINLPRARQLTGLLFVANSQLKKEVLRILVLILVSDDITPCTRNAILSELTVMKDILIACCHNEPVAVAQQALTLILTHPNELAPEPDDKDKIFLLMAKRNARISEMAKEFFLLFIAGQEMDVNNKGQRGSQIFLICLEDLMKKYLIIVENLEWIVQLLFDSFPSFVDIYLFVVQRDSPLISHVSTIFLSLVLQTAGGFTEQVGPLKDIVNITSGALTQLANTNKWAIYKDMLMNLKSLPDSIWRQVANNVLVDINASLFKTLVESHVDDQCGSLLAELVLRTEGILNDPINIEKVLDLKRLRNNWKALGHLLHERILWNDGFKTDLPVLLDVNTLADDFLKSAPDFLVEVINVKSLIIPGFPNITRGVKEAINLLKEVKKLCLTFQDGSTSSIMDQTKLLNISTNLLLYLIVNYKAVSGNDYRFIMRFHIVFYKWARDCLQGVQEELDWASRFICLLEFTLFWTEEDEFAKFLADQLQVSCILQIPNIQSQYVLILSSLDSQHSFLAPYL